MARRFRKKARHVKAKPSIVSMIPIGFLAVRGYNGYKEGGPQKAVVAIAGSLTGYDIRDGSFSAAEPMAFYGSVIATYLGKKAISYSGVNKALKGLPFRL